MSYNIDALLVEVIAAKIDENGTVSTAVEIEKLQSHHRRSRRSAGKTKGLDLDFINFREDSGRFKVISSMLKTAFIDLFRLRGGHCGNVNREGGGGGGRVWVVGDGGWVVKR